MSPQAAASTVWLERWQRVSASAVRAFRRYANWLVGISWWRFFVLAVLLLVSVEIIKSLPPFRWTVTETIDDVSMTRSHRAAKAPRTPAAPAAPALPSAATPATPAASGVDINIQIDGQGIRIGPSAANAGRFAASAALPSSASSASSATVSATASADGISITVPGNIDNEAVRDAVQQARQAILAAMQGKSEAAREAAAAAREAARSARDTAQAARDTAQAARETARTARETAADAGDADAGDDFYPPTSSGRVRRVHLVQWGDFLTNLALLWVAGSAIVKATYKARVQAEVKAAQAEETAEAESLKRQVVEARMAAMQAQVEPHFLFNTLASIDHLIEVDPPRASVMQKNLIALLRASMPTMREASGSGNGNGNSGGVRELGRELAVIRPYLEILKVRMEERLATQIDVPDGLLSAEFPPMMVQTLVENAIKHGLEPKAEGGTLVVKAEILHGKLAVSVADTGLGFGKAATAGTGVGLANIRERLQLLYGGRASLTVAENQPCGTRVTVTVPYKPIEGATA